MPRSKDPQKYPDWYGRALLGAYRADQPIRLPMPTKADALRTRQRLYAFIRATEAQEDKDLVRDEHRQTPMFHKVTINAKDDADGHYVELSNINMIPPALQGVIAGLPDIEAERVKAAIAEIEEADPTAKHVPLDDSDSIASRLFRNPIGDSNNDK